MYKTSPIPTKIFTETIGIVGRFIKAKISVDAYHRKSRKSPDEILDDLTERITNLEIEIEVEDDKKAKDKEDYPCWETYSDAIERAKAMPPCGNVLPGIIPENSICNIIAGEKTGKTIFGTQIGHDCAYGLTSSIVPQSEMCKVSKLEVYQYDAELDDDDMLERNVDLKDEVINRCPEAFFDNPSELLEHIQHTLSNVCLNTLVIIDNASAICPSFSAKDVKMMRKGLQNLQRDFRNRYLRLTFILIHHINSAGDIVGSKYWTRLGTLNIHLEHSNHEDGTLWLTVDSSRRKDALLHTNDALLLKKVDSPYPHFEYIEIENITNKLSKSTMDVKSANPSINKDTHKWVLSNGETEYVCNKYVPHEYGLGKLAKDIIAQRGIDDSKETFAKVKNAVDRLLQKRGLK